MTPIPVVVRMLRIDQPIVCPILVGRAEQVRLLQRLMGGPEADGGGVILVSGEAGIGKTRLISVARDLAAGYSWSTLQGTFFEHDRSVPFAGLVDLLRAFVADNNGIGTQEPGSLAPELASLLPDFADASTTILDHERDKRRLFRAFSHFLHNQAARQPSLIVVEDLHWADDASLEFLLYLSREVRTERLTLLLTFRSDAVHGSLEHLLAGLERERIASELRLTGLPLTDVDAMLRAMLGRSRPIRHEVLSHIHRLTDGNPFFIEELARSIVAEAGDEDPWTQEHIPPGRIPRSVNESVQRRTQQLPQVTRNVLQLAAVAGRRFDFRLLVELTGMVEADLLAAIKELIAAQLVAEDSVDRFSFRHALTRQAVYSELLLRERRLLHARIARTIEVMHGDALDEHAEDLAYHCFQAEDWRPAVTYYRKAGLRALGLFSPGAAAEHFSHALEAAHHLGNSEPKREILANRGKAHETLGDFDAARLDHEGALSEAYLTQDRHSQWQSLIDLGMLWAGQDYDRARQYYERASRLASEIGDRALIAHSLNRIGNWLVNSERPTEGAAHHTRALEIFRELDNKDGIVGSLDLLAMSNLLAGHTRLSREQFNELAPLYDEVNNRTGSINALAAMPCHAGAWHSDACRSAMTLAEADAAATRALELARAAGWRAGESFALWNLAIGLGSMGQYSQAIQMGAAALDIATDIDHAQWRTTSLITLGTLSLGILDLDRARELATQALEAGEATRSLLWVNIAAALLGSVMTHRGEIDEAEALLGPLVSEGPALSLAQRQIRATWVEVALARGRYEDALRHLDDLDDEVNAGAQIARLARARALALGGLGHLDEAKLLLQQAAKLCADEGRLSVLWRIQADLAHLAMTRGDLASAQDHERAAHETVASLAATIDDPDLRRAYLLSASAIIPGRERRGRSAAEAQGGITPREREVAAMVAQGLTNRAIAETLVLSERTVESHVANALAKLGFSSRAELAVWVVAHRLA